MKCHFTATGLILLLIVSFCAVAEPTDRYEELTGEYDDYNAIEKTWQESATKVPDLPAETDWVTMAMDSLPSTQVLALAKNSIRIDKKDWVVRYWVLLRSTGGAYNAAYQGVRCRTGEVITYAYGQKDRDPEVTLVTEPRWSDIGLGRRGNYTEELKHYVFCSGEVPRTITQMGQAVDGNFGTANPYQSFFDDY